MNHSSTATPITAAASSQLQPTRFSESPWALLESPHSLIPIPKCITLEHCWMEQSSIRVVIEELRSSLRLVKIMATAYIRNEPWEMGVHKRKWAVYLDVHKLPERPRTEMDRRRCYWGYCFESLATEDPTIDSGEGIHHINANVEYCAVIKTKLGAHRILMGAEMDCCDSTDDGRRFYVELKTSRELEYHTGKI